LSCRIQNTIYNSLNTFQVTVYLNICPVEYRIRFIILLPLSKLGCGILSEPPRGATWVAPTGGACSVAVTNINIMRRRQRLATSNKLVKAKDHY